MKQGSKLVAVLAAAGALGAAATAFAHGGDRARHGAQGADGCPMQMSMRHDGHRGMGPGRMAHGMHRGGSDEAPKGGADEAHEH